MRTIGEYYKETVLSLPRRAVYKREVETYWCEIRIENDLFGWKLYYNKGSRGGIIECHSEEEARYLKVFFTSSMKEVYVPKDIEYLRNILPRLERIKFKIDEILNSYLETITIRKVREQLKLEVYLEVTKIEEDNAVQDVNNVSDTCIKRRVKKGELNAKSLEGQRAGL